MLGFGFGLKGMAIAAVIAFAVGSASGWRVANKFSDAAHYKALTKALTSRIATLEDRANKSVAAAKTDQERAAAAEAARAAAEEKANDLVGKVIDGQCFGADDTVQLRRLWPGATGRKSGRAAGRPR